MNVLALVTQAVQAAVEQEFPGTIVAEVTRTQDPQFGDYQTNAAMHLAKPLKKNPREVAAQLLNTVAWQEFAVQPEIAGPGFINFRLSPEYLARQVAAIAADPRGGVDKAARPETTVLDYSSPNVAKRLHVGHLRSTIIGDAMKRVLSFLGHNPISDNHVGDWGTQFGMLIVAFRRWADEEALKTDAVGHLEDLYKRASALAKEDEAFAAEGRRELAKLHQGDPENLALWKRFVQISREDVNRIYEMLDVRFDYWLGESFYNAYLEDVVRRLTGTGLASEDQGALVIRFEDSEDKELKDSVYIVRKQDGAFLYSTTDIATLEYRMREWHPSRILYFVDRRQNLHFKQLFAVAARMGLKEVTLEHIAFGSILNPEGRPLKTREGGTPSLMALLQDGIDAAAALLKENRPDFTPEQIERVSKAVGIGAIKYADLSQNRNTDYKFDLEKMIAFEGNTGPYLQYSYARISSIFRKVEQGWAPPETVVLEHPDEVALARHLIRFEETLVRTAEACMPNYLCDYLFGLAKAYSTFYTSCPVLKSEGATRESRLALCRAVQHQIAAGLQCLGIEPLEEM